MPESSSPPIELSTGEPWRGLKPGMPRADALRVLEAAGAKTSDDANDPGWLIATADEWGLELRFEESGEQRLRQIALDDWEAVWLDREVGGKPLHEVLATIGDAAVGASWRAEDAVNAAFDDLQPPGAGPFTDEALLGEGTLWLPRRNLGLVMCEGAVNEIVWRRQEDVPVQFAGPLTDAQRQFTTQPDFEEQLRKRWASQRLTTATPSNPLQTVLTLLLAATLACIGWLGFQEVQRWQHAQTLAGQLVSIEKATRKPWIDHYTIKYKDPTGRPQTAVLEHGEFYIAPRETGEETQVCYLAGDPPRVKGPARARDSAFIDYVPWAIGAGATYLVLWCAAGFVWRLKRASAPPVPPASPSAPPPFMPDRGR